MPRPTVTLYCRSCEVGYASAGEMPALCPNKQCGAVPNWTTLKPYRLSALDRRLLRSLRITPTDRTDEQKPK